MPENFSVDHEKAIVTLESGQILKFDSPEAFEVVSRAWLRVGWDTKYVYGFTWLGRPIIQLPEDIVAIQELIFHEKPDVVVETGVAHGGSLVLYASILSALGHGRVVGIDVDIRSHNRKAIEDHPLSPLISLIEGNSTDEQTLREVEGHIPTGSKVLVVLDSDHSYEHVTKELEGYSRFMTVGDWIVACDGIMQSLADAPRARTDWVWNNPANAAEDFARKSKDFILRQAPRMFNEGSISNRVTYWPSAYLQKIT